MDALRRESLERARRTPCEVKAVQALEAMRTGIRLRRADLRLRHPEASDAELEERLRAWLLRDA